MVLEVLVSVSHFAATTPAIVGICLGATLFLVGIVAVTLFFYRRKGFVRRKSGVYLTPRSCTPLSEHMPLQSRLVIHRRSDTSPSGGVGGGGGGTNNFKSQHLVSINSSGMKKSPSPPMHFSTPKNLSPITPPMEDSTIPLMSGYSGGGGGGVSSPSRFSTTAEIHQKIYRSPHGTPSPSSSSLSTSPQVLTSAPTVGSTTTTTGQSLKMVHHRDNSMSPRVSPQNSPVSESSSCHDSMITMSSSSTMNQRNGNLEQQQQINQQSVSPTNSTTLVCNSNSNPPRSQNMSGGGANDLGILSFRIRYKKEKGALIVTVVKCEDLPVKDTTLITCDPYVKLQLLPEKQQRVKTRVLRHTRQPQYDEDFTFYGMQPNQLEAITLHFVVLSFDRYSRDDVIGEVFCPLSTMQLPETDNHHLEVSRDIQPRNLKMRSQGRGEVLVSLCWQPTSNRLTCVVLKARNLPKMDVTGLADPYVKLYLLYDGQRVAKKKTHIKKRTLNPVFNESFVFDLPPGAAGGQNHLDKISLQLLLLDWDRVTKNEVIGRLEVGTGATSGTATHHWTEVLNCPRRQIAEWHKLRD